MDIDKLRNSVSTTTKCKTPQESPSNEEDDILYNSSNDNEQDDVDMEPIKLHSGMSGESSSSSISGHSDISMRTASESEDNDGSGHGNYEDESNEEMSQDDSDQDESDQDESDQDEDESSGNTTLDEQIMVGLFVIMQLIIDNFNCHMTHNSSSYLKLKI